MVYVKQEVAIAHPLHTLEGVSFHVRTRPIIENLNPTVEEGRIHGLIGANGSGKSMLIKELAQQQKPSSGNISFSGRDIETLLQRGFARKIAVCRNSCRQLMGGMSRNSSRAAGLPGTAHLVGSLLRVGQD